MRGRSPLRALATVAALGLFIAAAADHRSAAAGTFDNLLGSAASLPPSAAVEPLANPPEYRSENGQLSVTLEAKDGRFQLGKFAVNGAGYNGVYAGPVLRVKPGDTLRVHLVNHLAQATNLHFHGLDVSPQGHSDNAMLSIPPGASWDYVIQIPKDHAPGLYWYHTHEHGFAERQLMAGLSGMLVIEGFQDQVPVTKGMKERLFALKEFTPDRNGDLVDVPKPYNFEIQTINGQLMPRIDIRPDESQLWRFSNQTANQFFRLSLDGHTFTVVGQDGRPLVHTQVVKELIIGPSSRADVIVNGGPAGQYRLVEEKTSTGPVGDQFPAQNMALMVSSPNAPNDAPPQEQTVAVAQDLNKPIPGDHIDAERLVSFSEDPVTGLFFINHNTFDHDRVDVKVPLGNTEEWTIRNSSDELHIFHIHQVAFQVISENGKPVPFNGLQDTVNIPIHGEVKVRIAFTDPKIVGRFMFHCHILEHEDKGMMAQIEVYDPKVGPMPDGPMNMNTMTMSDAAGAGDMAGMDMSHMNMGQGARPAAGAEPARIPAISQAKGTHAPG